jgi:hypothetical protein
MAVNLGGRLECSIALNNLGFFPTDQSSSYNGSPVEDRPVAEEVENLTGGIKGRYPLGSDGWGNLWRLCKWLSKGARQIP